MTISRSRLVDTTVSRWYHSWDANKNKTAETIAGVMSGYGFTAAGTTYDSEDRLTGYQRAATSGAAAQAQTWSLTSVGDWSSVTTNGTAVTRTHGPTHELLTSGGQSVTTDVKGNQTVLPASLATQAAQLGFSWDFDNRMKSSDIDANGSADVTFEYDALGRQIGRTQGSTAVVYVQADQQKIADYPRGGAASTATYRYVFGSYIDEPVVRKTTGTGGTVLYYHRNQQYSIYALTNSSGVVQERYAYTAYGQPTFLNASAAVQTSSAAGNRYTYTAREWDATLGLHYFRARWMSGLTGRFLTRDPIGFGSGDISLYVYVTGMPLTYVDPTGKCKDYCGPDATDLLAEELRYASNFWASHMRYWTSGFFRFRYYLGVVRWRHMLAIGPQLDWTNLTSENFQEDGKLIFCPTKNCLKTYEICGTCVHDHFIGNIMFGYWARLHGIADSAANLAAHIAQLAGETESRGFDKAWDQAGYELGRILADGDMSGMPMNRNTVCKLLTGNYGSASGYFSMANQNGFDYNHCEKCPKGLDGGVRRWAKRFNGGYPSF